MDAQEFDTALASALRVCRTAAEENLPWVEMLAHLDDLRESAPVYGDDSALRELAALETVIRAVGDVAAIGANLPREPRLIQVPDPPKSSIPIPCNLT